MDEYQRENLAKLAYYGYSEMTVQGVNVPWNALTDQERNAWRATVDLLFRHHDCRSNITGLQTGDQNTQYNVYGGQR